VIARPRDLSGPPLPANEPERLRALHDLNILDTPPEERFDRIVRLACKVLHAPIAYISFVDQDRQWFKSREGICLTGSSRHESFCGYTILDNQPFIVEDTHLDPRFASNPMVTGEPGVRFYAGVPLQSADGLNLGSLCLMDTRPRRCSSQEMDILRDLASLVEHELRLMDLVVLQSRLIESQQHLAEEKKKTDTLLRNILPDAIAEELKAHGRVQPSLHRDIAVMFTDFTNFTAVSSTLDPAALIEEIHQCFSAFDAITEQHHVEKLKTMGDGYLCVSGLPVEHPEHASSLLHCAFAIRTFIAERLAAKARLGLPYWNVRIGLHAGPAVSGVVGSRKFTFDLWGDTVNIASRLESGSEPGQINASAQFIARISAPITTIPRGPLPVKGRDVMEQFFIVNWI
jgi:class 3 adenylate cyclase